MAHLLMIELKLQSEWPKILQRLSAMAIVFDLACNGMNGGKTVKQRFFSIFVVVDTTRILCLDNEVQQWKVRAC